MEWLIMINLTINGSPYQYDGDDTMPLLWYLREDANLIGTKFGCGIGQCGACTVHMDGEAIRSCLLEMKDVDNTQITTIEGLEQNNKLSAVQKAWIDEDVAQCGYCQSGQIMAATALLKEYPDPTDENINDNITNICRCATYSRIRKAIKRASQYLNEAK